MLGTEFNLQDLFNKQWGKIAGSPQKPKFDNINAKSSTPLSQSSNVKFDSSALVNKKSPSKYYKKDLLGQTIFMPITLGGLFLPYSWVNIALSKNIVETPMTDRRGTVNELINTDDYRINIKGFVIGHDGTFPESDIESLVKLVNRNEALELNCPVTDIFLLDESHGGVDKVIVLSFQLNEAQGNEHVRGYEITLKTDQILELEYTGN